MQPESIIFDIDGTLWDSRALIARAYNEYLGEQGLEHLSVTAQGLGSHFGKTAEEIADVVFAQVPAPERYGLIWACIDREHRLLQEDPCDIAYPGVVETLERLARKYRLFVVSNSQQGYPELMMEKLGIRPLIRGTLCYGDTGLCKGETLKLLMQRHEIRSAVYVGDTQGDLEACEMAGLPFVFCEYGLGKARRFDASIRSFPELLDIF